MHRLSKSRFVAGYQCPKLLWWRVHEPDAKELQPNVVLADLFDQGQLVEERARESWPDGVVIVGDTDSDRIARTQDEISAGARVIFNACFAAERAFCAVDVLERNDSGWTLVEVKSTTSVKDYHLPDVAYQVYVVRAAGVHVTRAELMHLDKEYRHPGDVSALFVREDVTTAIQSVLADVPARIQDLLAAMDGPLPEYPVGPHCWFHNECAFFGRCWPEDPDHIRHFIGVGPVKTVQWMQKGVTTMTALPPDAKLNDKQKRQLRAQRDGRLIVEPGLAAAIAPAAEARRLGFLDFETVTRALPAWNALAPWGQVAAQFSYHERDAHGRVTHAEFLAEGPPDPSLPPDDPREAIARAMLDATADADRVVVYTHFEGTRIRELAERLPHLAEPLLALRSKLWDLKPPIEQHVYHPRFLGSFSLKDILEPLVGDLSYNDLIIVDGKTASVEIARLLFVSGRIPPAERERTRRALLDYCERDTFATVRLVERLIELARGA